MKKFLFAICLLASATAVAQSGGIDAAMMEQIRTGYKGTAAERAVKNALATTSITTLATNGDNLAMCDTHFSHQVKTEGITNQKSSGRCWLFTGLNVLRAKMIVKHDLKEFEFSQNYLSFYDLLEKSNLFLQGIIDTRTLPLDDRKVEWLLKSPIGDGGQFTGVSNLITKYGAVPKSAMAETYQSDNTRDMRMILSLKLREYALTLRAAKKSELQSLKTTMLTEIYGILVKCLGVPPTEFEWTRYNSKGEKVSTKVYTPKSFYDEFVGEDLESNYVMIMNDPTREYYKTYTIDMDRHQYDGDNWTFVNVPMKDLKDMAIASIKDSTMMYYSCDVGKYLNTKTGILSMSNFDYESLFGIDFPMTKADRIRTFASASSHAMTLMAVDLDENGKPRKWMVENSWGPTSGHKGHIIMTDDWFDEYMFRLVVERKYVPAETLELLKQKPVKLPAWDPLFAPEQ